MLGFSFVYGSVHLSLTKYAQWDVDSNLIAETYDSADAVAAALPDDAFYRIDAYGAHNNLGLWFDRSCLQFFNSTVAPSIMEFYPLWASSAMSIPSRMLPKLRAARPAQRARTR